MKLHELREDKKVEHKEGGVTIHTPNGSYTLPIIVPPGRKSYTDVDAHLGARGGE